VAIAGAATIASINNHHSAINNDSKITDREISNGASRLVYVMIDWRMILQ
jgi:hypothetical protein